MAAQNRDRAAEALLNERWASHGYERLTRAEQKSIALWWLTGDVMNGGFDQYFFNSSGDMALDALEGLRDIGAAETERILREALAVFGEDGYTPDRMERQDRLDAIDREQFEPLDRRFFDYPDDVDQLALAFLADHYQRSGLLGP